MCSSSPDGTEGVGYLLKDRVADVERFVEAVRRVAEGGSVLDPEVVAEMLGRRRHGGPLDDADRARAEVLPAMAEGHTNRGIAARMFVSDARSSATSRRSSTSSASAPPRAATAGSSRSWPTSRLSRRLHRCPLPRLPFVVLLNGFDKGDSHARAQEDRGGRSDRQGR